MPPNTQHVYRWDTTPLFYSIHVTQYTATSVAVDSTCVLKLELGLRLRYSLTHKLGLGSVGSLGPRLGVGLGLGMGLVLGFGLGIGLAPLGSGRCIPIEPALWPCATASQLG